MGDHRRGQVRPVLGDLGGCGSAVSTSPFSRRDDDDAHPAMTADAALVPWGAGGMRQMSLGVATRQVVLADRQQPGVLAL